MGNKECSPWPNLLEMIPMRRLPSSLKDGAVYVIKPKLKSRPGGWFLRRLHKPNEIKVKLDPMGTAAWKRCDGSNTVQDIANSLRKEFGQDIEPAEERLAALLEIMESNGLISYKRGEVDILSREELGTLPMEEEN